MTQHAHLSPAPFFLEAGSTGVLLIHGFTGAPTEMRQLGDYLHSRGLTVSGPLLPGHGTSPADLNRCRWTDWAGHVERALAELRARCATVFVGGLSLGSLLTLNLAAEHPELPGIITYSPAPWPADRRIYLTPVARYFIALLPVSDPPGHTDPATDLRIWCYDQYPVAAASEVLKLMRRVRRLLPRVTCPLLIVYGTGDRAIHPQSAARTFERAGSADKQAARLDNSGHCVTADSQWEYVAARTHDFILAHVHDAPR